MDLHQRGELGPAKRSASNALGEQWSFVEVAITAIMLPGRRSCSKVIPDWAMKSMNASVGCATTLFVNSQRTSSIRLTLSVQITCTRVRPLSVKA